MDILTTITIAKEDRIDKVTKKSTGNVIERQILFIRQGYI